MILRGKENIVLIRATEKCLVLHQMFFADEVRTFSELSPASVTPKETELALRLIDELSSESFQPEKYADEYRNRVMEMIDKKAQGEAFTVTAPAAKSKVVDLMAALEGSLGKARQASKPAKARKVA
jgi:DNA end-binding protein Ku